MTITAASFNKYQSLNSRIFLAPELLHVLHFHTFDQHVGVIFLFGLFSICVVWVYKRCITLKYATIFPTPLLLEQIIP